MLMSLKSSAVSSLSAAAGALLLAACMNHPPPPRHPGPYNDPVDAFNAVNAPYDPNSRSGINRPLTNDIGHLREARNAYKRSQAARKARVKAEQEACRNNPDARLVRIHDSSGDPDAVFCQSLPETEKSHADKD
jgi:hypothetical protein